MISRQLSGLETILRDNMLPEDLPRTFLRFASTIREEVRGFFMCRVPDCQVDSKDRAGPKVRHALCNNHPPPTRPRFRLAGIARSAPPCGDAPLVYSNLPVRCRFVR